MVTGLWDQFSGTHRRNRFKGSDYFGVLPLRFSSVLDIYTELWVGS